MAAVRRRVWQLSSIPGFGASKLEVSSSFQRAILDPFPVSGTRHFSQVVKSNGKHSFQRAILDSFPVSGTRHFSQVVKSNGKHLFLVDTLALVRRLEGEGVPSKQAEAITAAITEVLNDSLENVSQSLVSNGEMQKIEMMQESNLSKFKAEVQSSQVFRSHVDVMLCVEFEGHHFSLLQHETEKLRNDIEKMRSELRHEIDKVTAGQRLDLNLERGRIREELSNQNAETNNLTNKLDREIHSLRAQLEAAKYDVIKYCIGTLVSISAVGLAVLRILM
ncbi:Protein FMP32, mitochondrial [Glycine max]|nr:Protein FMP32, mitochondrial [Glycine max]